MKKVLSLLIAVALAFGVAAVVSVPSTQAAVPATWPEDGLRFVHTQDVLAGAAPGEFYDYENVNGATSSADAIRARVTLEAVSNSVSTRYSKLVISQWLAQDFAVEVTDYDISAVVIRYSTNRGTTWTADRTMNYTFRDNDANLAAWLAGSLIELDQPTTLRDFRAEVRITYNVCSDDDTPICGADLYWPSASTYADADLITDPDPDDGDGRVVRIVSSNTVSRVDGDTDDLPDDYWIRSSLSMGDDGLEAAADYKIEFFDSNDDPVVFATMMVNAYDIDNEQYVEFEDVDRYFLTEGTIITSVEQLNGDPKHLRFTSSATGANSSGSGSSVSSTGEARVQVNFVNVSTVRVRLGIPDGGTQSFDFSPGPVWTLDGGAVVDPTDEASDDDSSTVTRERNYSPPVVAPVGPDRAKLIVGGFDHNSRKLTAKMQARIDKWLAKHSHLSTLTCTGFTSLPKRPTDAVLSENRGITACRYAKSERPELKTSVSQGIEDPRPGSDVRRVRLVLTK